MWSDESRTPRAQDEREQPRAETKGAARRGGASPLLVVISAPSGGGKTTLCQQLLAARPQMTRAVTCTTRPPRAGGAGRGGLLFPGRGVVSQAGAGGQFLEHATVYGNSYGILKAEVLGKLRQGKDVLLNVDVQGAATIREKAQEDAGTEAGAGVGVPDAALDGDLEERLRKRGTDAEAVIQKRLSVARQEIAQWKNFDYLLLSSTHPGGFAADAGDRGGGEDAVGAGAGAGV